MPNQAGRLVNPPRILRHETWSFPFVALVFSHNGHISTPTTPVIDSDQVFRLLPRHFQHVNRLLDFCSPEEARIHTLYRQRIWSLGRSNRAQ